MSSLIDIMKKRADLTEFESRLSEGNVNPSTAIPEFEQAALEHYREMIRSGQIGSTEAHKLLRQRLQDRPEIERQAFESGSSMYTPTYGGVGTQLAIGTGLGWGIDKLVSAARGQPAQPVGQYLANMLSPTQLLPKTRSLGAMLPLLFFSANYLARPFQDPAYQRGESGYLSSLASSVGGAGRETRKRMGEAEQQYGTLGALPVHALNFAMDPVGGIAAAGTKAKEMLFYKEGELLDEAAEAVDRALRAS